MGAFLLSSVLLAPSVGAGSGDPEPPPVQRPHERHVQELIVDVEGVEFEAFASEMTLRSNRVPVARHGETAPSGSYAFVQITFSEERSDVFAVELIVSDGRAYDRRVEILPGESTERVLASNVAQLIVAIEGGTIEPDRSGVPIPEPQPPPKAPADAEHPKNRPPPPPKKQPKEPPPGQDPGEAIELGLSASLLAILGTGPPNDVDRFAGWGGGPSFMVRLPRAALVALDVRAGGRGHSTGARLVRTRVGLGAGYLVRAAAFELPVTLSFTVEPWVVLQSGSRVGLEGDPGERKATDPLLGATLRLQPGYRIVPKRRPKLGLRVGALVELAASTALANAPSVAKVSVETQSGREDAFRLGGVEAIVGAEVALWFVLQPG